MVVLIPIPPGIIRTLLQISKNITNGLGEFAERLVAFIHTPKWIELATVFAPLFSIGKIPAVLIGFSFLSARYQLPLILSGPIAAVLGTWVLLDIYTVNSNAFSAWIRILDDAVLVPAIASGLAALILYSTLHLLVGHFKRKSKLEAERVQKEKAEELFQEAERIFSRERNRSLFTILLRDYSKPLELFRQAEELGHEAASQRKQEVEALIQRNTRFR